VHGVRACLADETGANVLFHSMALPSAVQGRMLEQDEQIMSDYTDTKKSGIGLELSAGHTFHTKADF
jgi:hypothetical protein